MNNHKEQDKKRKDNPEKSEDGSQGRASYYQGSTTQGGSNHGQGSHYLAGNAYQQGTDAGKGTNYENEQGKLSDLDDDE